MKTYGFHNQKSELSKTKASFFHRDKFILADDQVVKQLDVEELARLDDRFGEGNIFRAGSWIPAGMIVYNNN